MYSTGLLTLFFPGTTVVCNPYTMVGGSHFDDRESPAFLLKWPVDPN